MKKIVLSLIAGASVLAIANSVMAGKAVEDTKKVTNEATAETEAEKNVKSGTMSDSTAAVASDAENVDAHGNKLPADKKSK